MTVAVAQAMGLYEQEGAVAAITRSRTALATGKMRLALAGAESLGGGSGTRAGFQFLFRFILFFEWMIIRHLEPCIITKSIQKLGFVLAKQDSLEKNTICYT